MSRFKPLSIGTLPRVFVNLLAMDDENISEFSDAVLKCHEMETWLATSYMDTIRFESPNDVVNRQDLAKFFLAVLNLSKVSRGMFVKDFARLLNELGRQDFWGTEGQCDPRGDRRDTGRYDYAD